MIINKWIEKRATNNWIKFKDKNAPYNVLVLTLDIYNNVALEYYDGDTWCDSNNYIVDTDINRIAWHRLPTLPK